MQDIELRRAERERVFTLLYQSEIYDTSPGTLLDSLITEESPYVQSRMRGITNHLSAIDDLIASKARGWTIDRMPMIDRCLLRFGIYELRYEQSIPPAVAIAETVELAKQYSTQDSARFVNGILAAVMGSDLPPTPEDDD
ncbi:MAG: transcription antitermination factor NusB [Acidimicrobiales bacterium]